MLTRIIVLRPKLIQTWWMFPSGRRERESESEAPLKTVVFCMKWLVAEALKNREKSLPERAFNLSEHLRRGGRAAARAKTHTQEEEKKNTHTCTHQPGSWTNYFLFFLIMNSSHSNKQTQAMPSSLLSNSVVTCLSFSILFYCTQDWRKVPSCVPLPSNNTFTFITKQIVIINIFIFLIFHVLYAQCPSVRRCGHSPSS